jgi:hypothetical protein
MDLYVNPLIQKRLHHYLKPVRSVNHVAQIGQASVEAGQKTESFFIEKGLAIS